MYLLENSSFSGWASMTNFDKKLFIPDSTFNHLEPTKLSNGSCSVVYRGKLYVYGPGSTDFLN